MIRLVIVEVAEDYKKFAWWDTITDKFIECCDEQAWETWDEFKVDWEESRGPYTLDRFIKLYDGQILRDSDREIKGRGGE